MQNKYLFIVLLLYLVSY